jgi:uncharacterized protein (DUF952 family)
MKLIYKILPEAEWTEAQSSGVFLGSAIDHQDGYIHLSDVSQVKETAARHFAAKIDLVLVAFDADTLDNLKWEASRGGALFPHHYGSIATALALSVWRLDWDGAHHVFPPDLA